MKVSTEGSFIFSYNFSVCIYIDTGTIYFRRIKILTGTYCRVEFTACGLEKKHGDAEDQGHESCVFCAAAERGLESRQRRYAHTADGWLGKGHPHDMHQCKRRIIHTHVNAQPIHPARYQCKRQRYL